MILVTHADFHNQYVLENFLRNDSHDFIFDNEQWHLKRRCHILFVISFNRYFPPRKMVATHSCWPHTENWATWFDFFFFAAMTKDVFAGFDSKANTMFKFIMLLQYLRGQLGLLESWEYFRETFAFWPALSIWSQVVRLVRSTWTDLDFNHSNGGKNAVRLFWTQEAASCCHDRSTFTPFVNVNML